MIQEVDADSCPDMRGESTAVRVESSSRRGVAHNTVRTVAESTWRGSPKIPHMCSSRPKQGFGPGPCKGSWRVLRAPELRRIRYEGNVKHALCHLFCAEANIVTGSSVWTKMPDEYQTCGCLQSCTCAVVYTVKVHVSSSCWPWDIVCKTFCEHGETAP